MHSTAALLQDADRLHGQGALTEATNRYRQVLERDPEHAQALYRLAVLECQQGRLGAGIDLVRRSLARVHNQPRAHNLLGMALGRLDRWPEALASFDAAIRNQPDYADAHGNRANALMELGRVAQAVASYERAVALQPDCVGDWLNLGAALQQLARHEQALSALDRAIDLRSDVPDAFFNRGNVLSRLERHEEALSAFEKALRLAGPNADVLNNCGNSLAGLNRHDEALERFEQALSLRPDHVDALTNRGIALRNLARDPEALASYDQALGKNPDHAAALYNRAVVLARLGHHPEAVAGLERLHCIDPSHPHSSALLADCRLEMCSWGAVEGFAGELRARIDDGLVMPFLALKFSCDAQAQLAAARGYVLRKVPAVRRVFETRKTAAQDKIRVAYVSADFCRHATAHLLSRLIEIHDRSRFEIIGVSLGRDDGSDARRRLERAFDRFLDWRHQGDREVAQRLNAMDVAIAVDLKGHTDGARPGIFAHRAAPVQVSYLGYPATTGADFIDYVIADKVVLPFDQQPFFTERIVHLPGSYQVNDPTRQISSRAFERPDAGLPDAGFVFCCFNNNWKITAPIFDVWMRLLGNLEKSVLWLLRSNEAASHNLRREAVARGIDPHRIVFAPRILAADHLARHRLADLFLDTLPYNAHTTASDALWAGLPLVTCRGDTFAGRVAASLLNAAGLPELITESLSDYETLACRLATDDALLQSMRRKLDSNRANCALFDVDRFRRNLEAAYIVMWERWQRGEGPRSFSIDVKGGMSAGACYGTSEGVTPGLDPGGHPSSQEDVDRRVKPGSDDRESLLERRDS
jgi:predicted O-linked N-acetylglucosamine transferase (SPINDLY family)